VGAKVFLMASVEVSKVFKAYGATKVIHGIDVSVNDGEFCVLVGPSGCGKSTLLRMIAGLEEISGGEIKIGGKVVNDMAPKDRDIAMVFQNYALYPHMTVRDNMGFSLMLAKVDKAQITERVNAAADILGLGPYLDRFPKQLSGGQRQRVAMGRAIVRRPQVFLFDEPLSNLDAKLRVAMRTEIKALHQRLKTTSVYVTHDQIEAMTMADKIVVLRDGIIEQMGTPLDLYDRPVNMFVAGFIGSPSMNFLAATASGAHQLTVDGGGAVELPSVTFAQGKNVTFGVRPENLSVGNQGEGFAAKIVVIEPTGADTQVFCRLGDKQDVMVMLRDRIVANPGDTIWLKPDVAKIHVFDTESGKRIN
jgi:multiple sugar transport system ATP-binding protein